MSAITYFLMAHLLVITLNAVGLIHISWLLVLLPEIVMILFFVIGFVWLLSEEYKRKD